jgi:Domain of unknown function (DUF6259)
VSQTDIAAGGERLRKDRPVPSPSSNAPAGQTVDLRGTALRLQLDASTGSLVSVSDGRREFVHAGRQLRPVFTLRLRDGAGAAITVSAADAVRVSGSVQSPTAATFRFEQVGGLDLDVTTSVTVDPASDLSYWRLRLRNGSTHVVEWIDYPDLVVPDDLVGSGGTARLLWPAMEGALIEDATLRDASWIRYQEPGFPSKGWEGMYPGPCPSQCTAYFDDLGGIYLGAHDPAAGLKSIEYYAVGGGIRLQFRCFAGADAATGGEHELGFPMVLGVFAGGWHAAADIYRDWYDTTSTPVPLAANDRLPGWFADSPVVVAYPVRGTRDVGPMQPNAMFPYVEALPHLRALSERLDSPVMALLMHWEGTAPWAPPYVWPPYGGAAALTEFIDAMHADGNLVGVYCSGIGWTDESLLDPTYSPPALTAEQRRELMCTAPDGGVPNSLICNGVQRWGPDLCSSTDFVRRTVVEQVRAIAASGCDYVQFFDQNLGGLSSLCYSRTHAHPPVPGRWQSAAMVSLFDAVDDAAGPGMLVGCEGGAAEPFLGQLPFNDLRFSIDLSVGVPVPLYQYLYHQYINNFMGNQNGTTPVIDIVESPNSILWRLGYSFVSGDMSTLVIKDDGAINWDWGTGWDVAPPNQDNIVNLVRAMHSWRRGAGRPFLCHGRMLPPLPLECRGNQRIALRAGAELSFPSLMTSRWRAPDGSEGQLVLNYTPQTQRGVLQAPADRRVELVPTPDGAGGQSGSGQVTVEVPALSAVLVRILAG